MAEINRSEAEEFLYREARLLDEGRLEEWLLLFTQDAYYWMPSDKGLDPREETPIIYDDRATLEDRISRLRSPAAHSQSPPSRTRHMISNVEVGPGPVQGAVVYPVPQNAPHVSAGTNALNPEGHRPKATDVSPWYGVYSNFVVYEARLGLERSLAGHYEHHLRREKAGWRIALKKVWLMNRDFPIYNITFIL